MFYDEKDYVYKESKSSTYYWTVLTKDSHCKRGEYAEEIDVMTDKFSPTSAKKVAEEAIKMDYIPELYPSRAEYRIPGYMYF